MKSPQNYSAVKRRYGSDADVESLTGISRKTLRKDRQIGRQRFPWYRVGRRVLYDLDEVEQIIHEARGEVSATVKGAGSPKRTVAPADASMTEIGHE